MVYFGYIILIIGVCTFCFGVLDNIFKINERIDELEERWVFDDLCSRH